MFRPSILDASKANLLAPTPRNLKRFLEAWARIELAYRSFANFCLTTWPPRLIYSLLFFVTLPSSPQAETSDSHQFTALTPPGHHALFTILFLYLHTVGQKLLLHTIMLYVL